MPALAETGVQGAAASSAGRIHRGALVAEPGPVAQTATAYARPEVEEKAGTLFEGTAEVPMLAQIDLRVEDSRKDPGVLEEIVSGGRLDGAVRQGSLCGDPGDQIFGVHDGGGGKAGARSRMESMIQPSRISMALRVSGLKAESSSSVSNPSERIPVSIVSACERLGSLKRRARLRSRCSTILKMSR